MAELKRAQCSRRGYLTHLKKLLRFAEELLSTAEPLGDDNVVILRDLHEKLQRKQDIITMLKVRILEATEGDDEIEAEVLQSEETTSTISAMKARITNRLNPTAVARTTSHATSPPPTTDYHESRVIRLPKLELPQFCNNPFTWQSFWDCFKASIHTNDNLTGVQKLSYLRSQLQGEASRVIAGFPL